MNLNNKFLIVGFLVASTFLFCCTPSRIVRPLEKGQKVINAHLGGPLIGFAETTIPIPFTSVLYGQGITNKLSAFGSLHTTSLLFGVFQTDIGVCYKLYYNEKMKLGISTTPSLNIAFDKWEGNLKVWPLLDINAYWELEPKKSFFYAGLNNWFELAEYKAHNQKQTNYWLMNPQAGFTYARQKWNYNIEMKYLVPNIKNEPNVVDYKSFNNNGAIGLYFGFTRKF